MKRELRKEIAVYCSVTSAILCFVVAVASAVSTTQPWIKFSVPDSVLSQLKAGRFEDLTPLYYNFPQLFYTRIRYVEHDQFCFPDMTNKEWREAFGRIQPKVQCYRDDYGGTLCSYNPFCLTIDEFHKRMTSNCTTCWPRPIPDASASHPRLSGFISKQKNLRFAVRAVLIAGVVLCWVAFPITIRTFFSENPCLSTVAGLIFFVTASSHIATIVVYCTSANSYAEITDKPFYGFVRNHPVLSATSVNYADGFNLVCASFVMMSVATLLRVTSPCICCMPVGKRPYAGAQRKRILVTFFRGATAPGMRPGMRKKAARRATPVQQQTVHTVPAVAAVQQEQVPKDAVTGVKLSISDTQPGYLLA